MYLTKKHFHQQYPHLFGFVVFLGKSYPGCVYFYFCLPHAILASGTHLRNTQQKMCRVDNKIVT
jgi:hypothetical protein